MDQGAVAEALASALAPAGWAPADDAPPYDFVTVDVTGEKHRRFFLGPGLGGWVGLYDQDHPGTEGLGAALSQALACAVCYLWSHHGDFWGYTAFLDGEVLDAFSSCLSPVPDFATAPLEEAARKVREGQALWQALEETGMATDMAIEMVRVGESTGALTEMLENVSTFHEEEIDQRVQTLVTLLEPILLLCMAVVIGTLLLTIYMPLLSSFSNSSM
ncbi:MAG: type II secretion system F family protein [Candidatus Methylomirabilales bacterium]